MSLLVLSIAALVVGPVIYRLADRLGHGLAALDGFVMAAIAGLAVVHIVPHAAAAAGIAALGAAVLGFLGPGLVERTLHRAADRVHSATLAFAVVGLLLHGFFDGVGLVTPDHDHGEGTSLLAIAVVLHRLPVGVTLWWLLRPRLGALRAGLVLSGLGAATIGGYVTADVFSASLDATWLGLLQALIAGSLLHVVLHRPPPVALPSTEEGGRRIAGVGALLGVVAVSALATQHVEHFGGIESGFGDVLVALALESAPALLFAFALAGLVQVFLPTMPLGWMHTGRPLRDAGRGVLFGLPLPICSCGVIPLYRTLVQKGVPATAGMAFLVATPELGLDAVLISLPLLGGEMAILRVVCAVVVALVIGYFVGRLAEHRRPPLPAASAREDEPERPPVAARVKNGLAYGFGEVVDHIGPWLLLGLAVAALLAPLLESEWLTALPWGLDVLIFALLGLPSYVCASAATPLVAVLIFGGVSPGAGLAFLLAGPSANVTTFGILASVHDRKVALAFGAGIAGLATVLGLVVNWVVGDTGLLTPPPLSEHAPSMLEIASLLLLTFIFAVSILRQGPRGFVGQVLRPYDEAGGHDHGGDDCCGHAH